MCVIMRGPFVSLKDGLAGSSEMLGHGRTVSVLSTAAWEVLVYKSRRRKSWCRLA
jgi:hypothetical protein